MKLDEELGRHIRGAEQARGLRTVEALSKRRTARKQQQKRKH
jgi:hypothetical protein